MSSLCLCVHASLQHVWSYSRVTYGVCALISTAFSSLFVHVSVPNSDVIRCLLTPSLCLCFLLFCLFHFRDLGNFGPSHGCPPPPFKHFDKFNPSCVNVFSTGKNCFLTVSLLRVLVWQIWQSDCTAEWLAWLFVCHLASDRSVDSWMTGYLSEWLTDLTDRLPACLLDVNLDWTWSSQSHSLSY